MKAQITSIKPTESKYGGKFYYVFFKDVYGKSYKTCLYPNMRNFQRWRTVLKVGSVLTHLSLKQKGMIDADSFFNFVGIKPIPNKDSYLKIENEQQRERERIQPKLF